METPRRIDKCTKCQNRLEENCKGCNGSVNFRPMPPPKDDYSKLLKEG